MDLTFEIDGQKVLSRQLLIASQEIKSMRPEFKKIGQTLERSALENIQNQGSEWGGKWKPLAPATVQARAKGSRGYKGKQKAAGVSASRPILTYTGKLSKSFSSKAEPMQVETGNDAPYFKYHQSRVRTSSKLPRRLILEMKAQDKVDILNIIAKGIDKRIGNTGRQIG